MIEEKITLIAAQLDKINDTLEKLTKALDGFAPRVHHAEVSMSPAPAPAPAQKQEEQEKQEKKPAKKKRAKKKKAKEAEETEETEEPEVTLTQIRDLGRKVINTPHKPKVKEFLVDKGAKTLSDLEPSQYKETAEFLKGLLEDG